MWRNVYLIGLALLKSCLDARDVRLLLLRRRAAFASLDGTRMHRLSSGWLASSMVLVVLQASIRDFLKVTGSLSSIFISRHSMIEPTSEGEHIDGGSVGDKDSPG